MAVPVEPVILSVKVALISTIITTALGTGTAWVMSRKEFPGKNLVETIIGLPLVLPPTVIGFGLLLLFGKHGPLGFILEEVFNVRVVFTWWAAVIAAAVVSFPLMYRSARAGFGSVDRRLESAARNLGASEWKVFYTISLPLALPGVLAGVLMAFARSLGEFGATVMLAGNIPGQTQTIPLAIYFSVESGDIDTAGRLVAIITAASFIITFAVNKWQGKTGQGFQGRQDKKGPERGEMGVRSKYTKGFT
ncbi:molybdate ABC transporter permease subunit [Thermincola potens]|uniref:Molybdenum transport system permease n=1 Tax=Thermincola potens (strain JR) TaxID=635013 RepID=D5XCE2_THEPJ|nr:molybdate ABC transporter permease subunit [Thermincola potens]ADG81568.1 molybdate ABC transporter, inner membrane subunit [Thermincola potens JR]